MNTHRAAAVNPGAGLPAPRKPEDWQKLAPCLPEEEEIHGACYIRTAKQPPCPGSFIEERGACFVAVTRAPRPRTSVEE